MARRFQNKGPRGSRRRFEGVVRAVKLSRRKGPAFGSRLPAGAAKGEYEHLRVLFDIDGADGEVYWWWTPPLNVRFGLVEATSWHTSAKPGQDPTFKVAVGDRIEVMARIKRKTAKGTQLYYVRPVDAATAKETADQAQSIINKLQTELQTLRERVARLEEELGGTGAY